MTFRPTTHKAAFDLAVHLLRNGASPDTTPPTLEEVDQQKLALRIQRSTQLQHTPPSQAQIASQYTIQPIAPVSRPAGAIEEAVNAPWKALGEEYFARLWEPRKKKELTRIFLRLNIRQDGMHLVDRGYICVTNGLIDLRHAELRNASEYKTAQGRILHAIC